METVIDIVVTTRNRLPYLRETLRHIYERTRSPYRLRVIDDASKEATVGHLIFEEWRAGRIDSLLLHNEHTGARANQNAGVWLAFSDPFVLCDDDVLCPDVDPDWLARGIAEMRLHPELAMLALHHPGAKTKPYQVAGNVTYCKSLGATFLFVRRQFAEAHMLPHKVGDFGRPMEPRCQIAHQTGWKIAYLTNTYCYHIGKDSVLDGKPYKGRFIQPIDWKTLEPPVKERN
jgi:hypothetical protein